MTFQLNLSALTKDAAICNARLRYQSGADQPKFVNIPIIHQRSLEVLKLNAAGLITSKEIATAQDCTQVAARYHLKRLIQGGYAVRMGETCKGATYQPTEEGLKVLEIFYGKA